MATNIDAHNTAPGSQDRFDLAVIGAGCVGFSVAITAAELGAGTYYEAVSELSTVTESI